MEQKNGLLDVFNVFKNTESYFDDRNNEQSRKLIINQLLIICLLTFLYGVVMGSYHSFLQSIVAGLKITFLFLCSIIICFPSFFVIQQVLGSKMTLKQMIFIVLSGFVLTSAIAFSFAPIIILFQITGGNYHFLQLLHVAIYLFSGIFGMRLMIEALKFACETKDIYPRIGVTVFRIWIVILAFVGIQLAWNLRPFLCNKDEEFKLFRKYEGNFYTAIVYSVQQLVSREEINKNEDSKEPAIHYDSISVSAKDSAILNLMSK
jgi:hypothetical protein